MEIIRSFKALSDPTRIRLLHLLDHVELNVNEIVQVIGMIQSGTSRHLKILMESGLIVARKEGSFTYYSSNSGERAQLLVNMIREDLSRDMAAAQDLKKADLMIQNRQNRTKRFFRTVAPQWDRLKREVLGEFDLNREIRQRLDARGRIADLGCGTGEMLQSLLPENNSGLIGIDSSPEMLEQARVRLAGFQQIELRLGELEHLPMGNTEVDAAVMNMVLHHTSQPKVPISEVFRTLKPGGCFILSDFEKHDNEQIKKIIGGEWLGFEKEKLLSWLTAAGFLLNSLESFIVNHGLTINLFVVQKPHKKETL